MSGGWASGCFTVAAELGLHARPAGEFAALARRFDAEIFVSKGGVSKGGKSKGGKSEGGEWVDGREVLELLSLAAAQGARLHLRARGREAERAVAALGALLERPSGERPPPEQSMA